MKIRTCAAFLFAAGLWAACSPNAHASIVFNLDALVEGTAPAAAASASNPWLTAEFKSAPNNRVEITMSAVNLTGRENVHLWLFNVNPGITEKQLDSLYIVSKSILTGSFDTKGLSLKQSTIDGITRAGFSFDFMFGFPNPSDKRFEQGDTVKIVLGTKQSNFLLTENTFFATDTSGQYYTAAHIRTLGPEGEQSGWIGAGRTISDVVPVPEPTTILGGALLLLPFALTTFNAKRARRGRI